MEISQVGVQQITSAQTYAADRTQSAQVAGSVDPNATNAEQIEYRRKFDTLELSNEGRWALNNAQKENADTKSLAMTGVAATIRRGPVNAPQATAPVQQAQPTASVEASEKDYAAEVKENLSNYTTTELKQLMVSGTITRSEYVQEMEAREAVTDDDASADEVREEERELQEEEPEKKSDARQTKSMNAVMFAIEEFKRVM
ncbi:MAG: hypothetical protein K6F52_06735 [Clostridia bacterium]|nr:hypothetical protein [Clostridia bacterium]